jgi:hypothetical protein
MGGLHENGILDAGHLIAETVEGDPTCWRLRFLEPPQPPRGGPEPWRAWP